jgi:hypothetical protein
MILDRIRGHCFSARVLSIRKCARFRFVELDYLYALVNRRFLTAIAICNLAFAAWGQSEPLNWHYPASFPNQFGYIYGLAYGNGAFVAVGQNGALALSQDGSSWTQYLIPPLLNYFGVLFCADQFFAFGNWGSPSYIHVSSNGLNWSRIYEQPGQLWSAAAFGNGRLVFVGPNDVVTTTWPATNWMANSKPAGMSLQGVAFGMGRFVACGAIGQQPPAGIVISSADGVNWRYDYGPTGPQLNGIAYGNGVFVVPRIGTAGDNSGFLISTNLATWNYVSMPGTTNSYNGEIAFGGGQFIAALGTNIYTSPDGLAWTKRITAGDSPTYGSSFAYGLGTFLAYGIVPFQSDVVTNPTSASPSYLALNMFPGVSITGVEGLTYRVECSTNLGPQSVWQPLTNLTLPYSPFLWIDTARPGLSQKYYRTVQLE